jgi:predicted NodU family carbamoyl transferase
MGRKLMSVIVGYRKNDIHCRSKALLGKSVHYYSSSHERSHILCAYGMSNLPKGTPCYALIWEGEIGTFYEIDSDLNHNCSCAMF